MKKIVIFLCIGIYATMNAVAAPYVFDQKVIQDIYRFKQELYLLPESTDYKKFIDNFLSKEECKELPPQELYTVRNIAAVERLNFLDSTENQKGNYYILDSRYHESSEFMKSEKNLSEWFLVSFADVESRLINYAAGGEMYRISMEAKSFYEKALRQNKKFSYGYIGYASWLFFAPAVAGGGYDAALKQFGKAIKNADTDFDIYIALIYRSQVYYKMGKSVECKKDLKTAHDIYGTEKLTDTVRVKNEKGKSLFE